MGRQSFFLVLAKGNFENIKNNPVLQQVQFPKKQLHFIRFTGLKSVDNKPYLSVAELGILSR